MPTPDVGRDIVWLEDCSPDIVADVGGKASGLGRLLAHGFRVPGGFVVTTAAYRRATSSLSDRIGSLTAASGTPEQDRHASAGIRALFDRAVLPADLATVIGEAYELLGGADVPVAVRSSAVAEDTANASFAGQQETFLWIRGVDAVREAVVDCWASLFTPHAIAYRRRFSVPVDDVVMGVVIQRMVPARSAGVMMTLHPATGDRSTICIESAFGLGEAVVRGEVEPDRFEVDRDALSIRAEAIGDKKIAYRFDEEAGKVRRGDLSAERRAARTLEAGEVAELARLGRDVDEAFGRPMDIEWAIGADGDDARAILLLQARPETYWSNREPPAVADDVPDPLMDPSGPDEHWTRSNVGEAVPGVMTPLNWSVWSAVGERTTRGGGYALGAISAAEARAPERRDERVLRVFHGRLAVSLEYMATLGDRMPGLTGADTVASMFGRVPEGMTFRPTRRRYPIVAWRLTKNFVTYPGAVRRLAAEFDPWWLRATDEAPGLDHAAAVALFHDALERFERAVLLQTVGFILVFQPVYDALLSVAGRAGLTDVADLTGPGHAEVAVISDIWRASRGELTLEQVVRRHGFHGPDEGEIASRVWREDRTPLERLVGHYANADDADDPVAAEAGRARRRAVIARQVLAAHPRHLRPVAGLVLWLGRHRMPMRGVAKRNFLQGLDVARAAARRIGEHLVAEGRIDTLDDTFFLSTAELTDGPPPDVRRLVAARRRMWHEHQRVDIPGEWRGVPVPVPKDSGEPSDVSELHGVGVSPGVHEGIARIVLDPGFADVQPGEVLVAPHTDPGWSSIMFVSSALVVDIGGALSHAAVVARELGIPCVVSTRSGTRDIRTGDRVRVDGASGLVRVVDRAADTTTETVEQPRRAGPPAEER